MKYKLMMDGLHPLWTKIGLNPSLVMLTMMVMLANVSIHDNYIHYFQIIIPTNLPTPMVKAKEEVERKWVLARGKATNKASSKAKMLLWPLLNINLFGTK
jgi:hypothetical protein